MPRPLSVEWQYFQGEKNAKCNKCSAVIVNAKVEKLRRHILHHCDGWTADDRKAYLQRLENQASRTSLNTEQSVAHSERAVPTMSQETLNKLVARYIFESGSALGTVELQCFKDLVLLGRQHLQVPPRSLLTGRLLDEEFQVELAELVDLLRLQPFVSLAVVGCTNVSDQIGVNVALDGPNMTPRLWTTLVTGPDERTGPYIAEMIGNIIDEVEEARGKAGFVTACTTDNVQAMQAAATILENERGVFCTGCPAQTLNLLIEDIAKLGPVRDTLNLAHSLANYFLQRRQLLARFVEEQAELKLRNDEACTLALSLPVAPRWYSVFNCISSVIENRDAIAVVFEDLEFMKRFQNESTTGTKKKKRSPTTGNEKAPSKQKKPATGKRKRSAENQSECERTASDQERERKKNRTSFADASAVVQNPHFWELGQQVLKLLAPIVEKLGLLETDECSIGEVYATFAELLQSPLYCRPAVLVDTAAEILGLIQSRWKLLQADTMGIERP